MVAGVEWFRGRCCGRLDCVRAGWGWGSGSGRASGREWAQVGASGRLAPVRIYADLAGCFLGAKFKRPGALFASADQFNSLPIFSPPLTPPLGRPAAERATIALRRAKFNPTARLGAAGESLARGRRGAATDDAAAAAEDDH